VSGEAFPLAGLLGAPVTDDAGSRVGTVADVAADLADPCPRVVALLVRDGARRFAVPWDAVVGAVPGAVVVRPQGAVGRPPDHDALLLERDVVDAQVIDLRGRRLARVGDVLLALDGRALRVVAVDLGLAGVLRRLGARRLAGHLAEDRLAWPDLHLAGARGHRLQLRAPAAAVHHLPPEDLHHVLRRLPVQRGADLLEHLPAAGAATAMRRLPPEERADYLALLPREHAGRIRREAAAQAEQAAAPEPAHRHRRFRVMRARRHVPV
jgi:sporulation protein YlmC with PRC-barrel domain